MNPGLWQSVVQFETRKLNVARELVRLEQVAAARPSRAPKPHRRVFRRLALALTG